MLFSNTGDCCEQQWTTSIVHYYLNRSGLSLVARRQIHRQLKVYSMYVSEFDNIGYVFIRCLLCIWLHPLSNDFRWSKNQQVKSNQCCRVVTTLKIPYIPYKCPLL